MTGNHDSKIKQLHVLCCSSPQGYTNCAQTCGFSNIRYYTACFYLCMYVCMYVCMYACVYVIIIVYVCMYLCMSVASASEPGSSTDHLIFLAKGLSFLNGKFWPWNILALREVSRIFWPWNLRYSDTARGGKDEWTDQKKDCTQPI